MYDFNKKRNHVNNLLFTAHLLKLHTKYLFTYNIPIKQPILPAFGDSKRRDNLSFTRDFHHCAHDLDAPKKISRQTAGRKTDCRTVRDKVERSLRTFGRARLRKRIELHIDPEHKHQIQESARKTAAEGQLPGDIAGHDPIAEQLTQLNTDTR